MIEWMLASEIEKIRVGSPSANSPAWKEYYDQMARKIVLKRTCNYIPQNSLLSKALEIDNLVEKGELIQPDDESVSVLNSAGIPLSPPPAATATDSLAKTVGAIPMEQGELPADG
jgi:recombinational DNA repair protein RecT